MLKKTSSLSLSLILFLADITVCGSSRNASYDYVDRQTILTEYIEFGNSVNHSSMSSRPRRLSSIWIPPTNFANSAILESPPTASFPLIPIESEYDNSEFSHSSLTEIHSQAFEKFVGTGAGLSVQDTVTYIRDNDSFRRDHLVDSAQEKKHYVIISKPLHENQFTTHDLVELDDDLHIKSIRSLSFEEVININSIEEEVIYNALIYELPSQIVTTLSSLNSLANFLDNRVQNISTGISAGSDNQVKYGLWVKGASSFLSQNKFKKIDAFKTHSSIGGIGFDIGFDNAVIGLLAGIGQNTTNFVSSTSKENTRLYSLSFYNQLNLKDFDWLNSITAGKLFINNSRDLLYKNKMITSKHTGNILNLTTGLSKKYNYNSYFIAPSLSINYSYLTLKAFKENGVKISKNIDQRLAVSPKLSFGKDLTYNNLTLTASIYYRAITYPFVKTKQPKITILHNSQVISTSKTKNKSLALSNIDHAAGVGLEILSNQAFTISTNYEYLIAKKSKSHTGLIALKYNF